MQLNIAPQGAGRSHLTGREDGVFRHSKDKRKTLPNNSLIFNHISNLSKKKKQKKSNRLRTLPLNYEKCTGNSPTFSSPPPSILNNLRT